jgi:hypothetical protein
MKHAFSIPRFPNNSHLFNCYLNYVLLPSLFKMSLVPSLIDGASVHPYLAYTASNLLIFWFMYSLAAFRILTTTRNT